jgi:hypothetical protein
MTLRERRLHATEKGVSNAQQSKSLQLILGRGGHGCMSVTLNYCMQMHADLGSRASQERNTRDNSFSCVFVCRLILADSGYTSQPLQCACQPVRFGGQCMLQWFRASPEPRAATIQLFQAMRVRRLTPSWSASPRRLYPLRTNVLCIVRGCPATVIRCRQKTRWLQPCSRPAVCCRSNPSVLGELPK